jgi:hypothetical protein
VASKIEDLAIDLIPVSEHQSMRIMFAVTSLGALLLTCSFQLARIEPNSDSSHQIDLQILGYNPPRGSGAQETPGFPPKPQDDFNTRIVFVDNTTLALSFTRLRSSTDHNGNFPQAMEAFFVDTNSGLLISRKTWPSRYRRWFNDSWDTEGRIIPIEGGFLVHSGDSLYRYSTGIQEKRERQLADTSVWAIRVAPLGRRVQAARINGNDAEVESLDLSTLEKGHTDHEFPTIVSISDDGAAIRKLAHCLDLQVDGKPVRQFCCHDTCSKGLPTFLDNRDILSIYDNGFEVLSTNGEMLWKREEAFKPYNRQLINGFERSLDGSRFAIMLIGKSRSAKFDGTKTPKNYATILVYDSSSRTQIFNQSLKFSDPQLGFALSPNGGTLAILSGRTVHVYRLPQANVATSVKN